MKDKEYIERDRIVKFIENGLNDPDKTKAFGHDAVEILAEIHLDPAADVVEVVRCKDCKNAYINSFSAQSGVAVCRFLANRSNGELAIVQQDDFCSRGERKEQDNV